MDADENGRRLAIALAIGDFDEAMPLDIEEGFRLAVEAELAEHDNVIVEDGQ